MSISPPTCYKLSHTNYLVLSRIHCLSYSLLILFSSNTKGQKKKRRRRKKKRGEESDHSLSGEILVSKSCSFSLQYMSHRDILRFNHSFIHLLKLNKKSHLHFVVTKRLIIISSSHQNTKDFFTHDTS